MDKIKKRDRSVNFSYHETELLMILVDAKKHIIENKKSDAHTWQLKENAWNAIEKDFNQHPVATTVYREAKHLKSKYEALKRDTRKKVIALRDGEVVPPLTPLEKTVRELTLYADKANESNADLNQSTYEEIQIHIKPDPDLVESDNAVNDDEGESTDKINDSYNVPIEADHTIKVESMDNIRPASTMATNSNNYVNRSQIKLTKWEEWRLASLRARKHPALSRPLKRPFEKSSRDKQEEETIQKKILQEELENKVLQNTLLRQELEHKKRINELERQQMTIKVETMKVELHHLRTANR